MSLPSVPLDELLEFPLDFMFRAVAHASPDVTARCVLAVEGAVGRTVLFVEEQASAQGNYKSVRVTVRLENAQELSGAYLALQQVEGVRMTL